MKIIILSLLLVNVPAFADFYLDVGIGVHDKNTDSFVSYYPYSNTIDDIKNPIGVLDMGYQFDTVTISFMHLSSMQQEDSGLNMLMLKKRIF